MKTKAFLVLSLTALLAPIIQAAGPRIELVTTFDYPGENVIFTAAQGINEAGDCVGYVTQSNLVSFGFIRRADGSFSAIQPPDAFNFSGATGINNQGVICGTFADAFTARHGYILTNGGFAQYDVPGETHTELTGLNDDGDLVGVYYLGATAVPFVAIGGSVERIFIRDLHDPDSILPSGINNADEFVGNYSSPNRFNSYGFLGTAAAKTKDHFLIPGSVGTNFRGLNDSGMIVGSYAVETNGHARAFVLSLPHTYIPYNFQGSVVTEFTGINNGGLVCGYYKDQVPHLHGVIAQLTSQ